LESDIPQGRPFYTRLAILGFSLIALSGLIGAGVNLLAAEASSLAFTLPLLLAGCLMAGALWRFGAWAKVVAALLALAMLAFVLPFAPFGLAHPESAADFVPLVLLIAGAALGLVGSIAALIARRRGGQQGAASPVALLGLMMLLAVLTIAIVTSLALTATSRTTLVAESKASAVEMAIEEFQYSPGWIEAAAGSTVRLAVANNDATLHTFTLDEVGLDVSIPPGAERLVEFTMPASGTFKYYCVPHSSAGSGGRSGMVGTLVISAAAEGASE
jgi:plastocyanin